jgi:hypothetical protein
VHGAKDNIDRTMVSNVHQIESLVINSSMVCTETTEIGQHNTTIAIGFTVKASIVDIYHEEIHDIQCPHVWECTFGQSILAHE